MNTAELFELIAQEVPETREQLHLDCVRYYEAENRGLFSFFSDTLIGERSFLKIKRILEKQFPRIKCSLRISCPSLGQEFLENPGRYALPLNQYLLRHYPAVRSWEFDLTWVSEDGRLYLETPDEFSMNYLRYAGVKQALEQAIYDVFAVRPPLELRVSGDAARRMEEIREERERQEELEQRRASSLPPKKDRTGDADKQRDDRIKGRRIADQPVPIAELTQDGLHATVLGRVIEAETREISGGERLLLTLGVTDYTSTITCKIFLRYRENYFASKKEEETDLKEHPITPEEKEKVREIVNACAPGKDLLLRGEVKYDSYSRENVLMVRDISRASLGSREDTAPEKRIELHTQ